MPQNNPACHPSPLQTPCRGRSISSGTKALGVLLVPFQLGEKLLGLLSDDLLAAVLVALNYSPTRLNAFGLRL